MAQQVRRAAALTAEQAAQSEEKVAVVCDHSPGLRDELVEHITAPNMGAGGSHPQAEMMQHSPSANPLLSTGNDESSMRRQLRGMQLEKRRKGPDHWRIHAEAKQRLHDKEEAWDLFQRLPRFGGTARQEFEREYDSRFRPTVSDEKSLQAWVEDPLKIFLALNRK